MRPVQRGDILAAARVLYSFSSAQRSAAMTQLLHQAKWADVYRKETGREHPLWGNGSLEEPDPVKGERTESYFFLDALCRLYEPGVDIDWDGVTTGRMRPGAVPGQTFMHKRYWIEGVGPKDFSAFISGDGRLPVKSVGGAPADGWHYTLDWTKIAPVPKAPTSGKPVNWLVVGPDDAMTGGLLSQAAARGEDVFWICAGEPGVQSDKRTRRKPDASCPDGSRRATWSAALGWIFNLKSRSGAMPWKVMVHFGAAPTETLTPTSLERRQSAYFGALIPLLQGLHDQAYVHAIWPLTEDAQAATDQATDNPGASALWGFGKTLFLEHPAWLWWHDGSQRSGHRIPAR